MQITPALLDQALRDALGDPPRVQGAEAAIEFVPQSGSGLPAAWEDDKGFLFHAVRLCIWGLDGDTWAIVDVKEQPMWLLRPDWRDQGERLLPALRGWAMAVAPILDRGQRLRRLVPYDLLYLGVLDLRRPRTADEFAAAYRAKSRLGRWLT